ncbi:YcxB family protein [Streptomyces sp. HUAS 31]|uniref:YcxB family protein n=1 Tax=Streptomyces TaxID=1883 RepID=UPI0023063E25|nr:YcxB family protein [Streptomyces sp. HUAS 31]WCE00231.1 YcxB family protein [Streptomyces sp. HUAS 31]
MELKQDGTQETVELVYQPTRADILAGVLVRERRRRLHLVRWGFTGLFAAAAVLMVAAQGSSSLAWVTAVLCAVLIWSIPHLQAHHALSTVSWQGEYRTSVNETGIATDTVHTTLLQRWSVFRGFRETRDHVVLLSRDPNILLVEVLPKRGLHAPEEAERLLAVLSRHLPRV